VQLDPGHRTIIAETRSSHNSDDENIQEHQPTPPLDVFVIGT